MSSGVVDAGVLSTPGAHAQLAQLEPGAVMLTSGQIHSELIDSFLIYPDFIGIYEIY